MHIRTLSLTFPLLLLNGAIAQSVIPVTSLADSGPGTLRTAIASAFPGDTVRIQVTGTILITSGAISYNKDLVIDGPGMTLLQLNGNDAFVPLVITGGSTWMEGLTITNGRNPNGAEEVGGGMGFHGDTLVMHDVRITSCKQSGIGGYSRLGGGLRATCLRARLIDCGFDNNIIHSEADDNGYAGGGGIYLQGPDLLLRNCSLVNNIARGRENQGSGSGTGGGLYVRGSGRIEHCQINGNQAIGISYYGGGNPVDAFAAGGGIYVDGTSNITITGGTISGNSCVSSADHYRYYQGAGICAGYATLHLNGVTVSDNSMPTDLLEYEPCLGGGIYLRYAAMTTRNCTIIGNSARQGSGIYCDNMGSSNDDNRVALLRTRVLNGHGSPQWAAIQVAFATAFRMIDSEASDNDGLGLACASTDTIRVDRCLFHGNNGGGASLSYTSNATQYQVINSTFDHNSGQDSGGLALYEMHGIEVRNCTFMNDTLTSNAMNGREIHANNSDLTLRNTILGASLFQPLGAFRADNSTVVSGGGNICRDNSAQAYLGQPNDLNSANPQMGDFGDHGGFTRTWSLASNSTSIDQGGPDTLSVDQRGFLRDGNSDAGAFESGAEDPQVILLVGTSSDDVVCLGHELAVSVQATSGVAIHYQWSLNGTEIPGATGATYTTSATVNDAGSYSCSLATLGDTIIAGPILISVDLCTGMKANTDAIAVVRPLPVQEDLFVSTSFGIGSLQLFDATGRLVLARSLNGATAGTVAVGDLQEGAYVVRLIGTQGERWSEWIVKAR